MNMLLRTEKLVGDNNLIKLKNTKVLLIGLGGVGGSCFETLIRSGIKNITVFDPDKFEESNLNRQILSKKDNIGLYKVAVAKARANDISGDIIINTYNEKVSYDVLTKNNIEIDYIIDACDDVGAKIDLVKYAINKNIKIISCMGTGNRLNPEKLCISNIWKTENDPLAKKIRQELRKAKINYKLPVVFSKEVPAIKTKDFVGSIATVVNSAGILLTSYVINDVIQNKKEN